MRTEGPVAQPFGAFIAHTNLQLIGGSLVTEADVCVDGSAKDVLVGRLVSRFTRDMSRPPGFSQQQWPLTPGASRSFHSIAPGPIRFALHFDGSNIGCAYAQAFETNL